MGSECHSSAEVYHHCLMPSSCASQWIGTMVARHQLSFGRKLQADQAIVFPFDMRGRADLAGVELAGFRHELLLLPASQELVHQL